MINYTVCHVNISIMCHVKISFEISNVTQNAAMEREIWYIFFEEKEKSFNHKRKNGRQGSRVKFCNGIRLS